MSLLLEAGIVGVGGSAHRCLRFIFTLAVTALAVAGCAQVEQRQQLAEPVGRVMRTPVGGTIATIVKDRDLPNAFGRADIYGRTVDAGFTRIITVDAMLTDRCWSSRSTSTSNPMPAP
jgi:hypothetical protein